MNYRRNHTSGAWRFRGLIFAVMLIVVLYVAGKPLLSFLSRVFTPIASFVSSIERKAGSASHDLGAYFSSKGSLEKENLRLSNELDLMRLVAADKEVLEAENTKLRTLLGGRIETDQAILAEVILHPPSSPYDTLVIDIGAKDGVNAGDSVRAEGFIVGEISSTLENTSVVKLWSHPDNLLDVSIGDMFSGRAEGQGGGSFHIRAPRDTSVSEGDAVLAPGLDGLILGVIGKIVRDAENPFADIYVISPVNIRTVRFVEVAQKKI